MNSDKIDLPASTGDSGEHIAPLTENARNLQPLANEHAYLARAVDRVHWAIRKSRTAAAKHAEINPAMLSESGHVNIPLDKSLPNKSRIIVAFEIPEEEVHLFDTKQQRRHFIISYSETIHREMHFNLALALALLFDSQIITKRIKPYD